jgi:hypothetical protein
MTHTSVYRYSAIGAVGVAYSLELSFQPYLLLLSTAHAMRTHVVLEVFEEESDRYHLDTLVPPPPRQGGGVTAGRRICSERSGVCDLTRYLSESCQPYPSSAGRCTRQGGYRRRDFLAHQLL